MPDKRIYTKTEIEAAKEGLNHYFPYEVGDSPRPRVVDDIWIDLTGFKWGGRDDFFTKLSEITGVQELSTEQIRKASGILEEMGKNASESVRFEGAKSPVNPNTLTPDQLKQLEEEMEAKETERKSAVAESKEDVTIAIERQKVAHGEQTKESETPAIKTPEGSAATQAEEVERKTEAVEPEISPAVAIERQKILYQEQIANEETAAAALSGQAVYYKVNIPLVKETLEVKDLREQAQANPKKLVEDLIKDFKRKATSASEGQKLTPEEVDVVAKQAAITTYEVLTGNSPIISATIINRVVLDAEVLNKVAPDPQTQEILKNASSDLFDQKIAQFELAKRFIDLPKVDGLTNVENVTVEISDARKPSFEKFDIKEQIISPHIDSLNRQSEFLDTLKDLGGSKGVEVKSKLLLKTWAWLDTQIAKLPAGSALAKAYNSELVQLGLSSLGIVEAVPWVAAEGSWLGRTIISSGYGNVAGFIQAKTGIDLGIKRAVGEIGKKVIEKAGGQTIGQAAGKAAAGLLPKLFAALGTLGSWATLGLSLLAGYVLGKIAEKIDWKKVKKVSIAVFGGAWAMTYGRKIVKKVGRFFGRLLRDFLKTVFNPLLIIILVFPVLVAITLFIINSGAYIVPPALNTPGNISSPYIGITKTPDPPGPFSNDEFPETITYNVTVQAKKGALTNVSIGYDCQVISGSQQSCPPTSDTPYSVDSISPSLPYSFTYTSTYDQNFKDSTIIDTITVTADTSEKSGVSSDGSASVTFGSPPISCPLLNGAPANSMNYSYNSQTNTGHGSTQYWDIMGEPHYRYPLPQLTGCFLPTDCPYYGYALDVFPQGIMVVSAPTVLGRSLTWNLAGTFTNPGAGYSLEYTDTTGTYTIILTHVANPNAPGTVSSGTEVSTLFSQGENTHLHIEFQSNGRWVKPEDYFCK